MNLEATIPFRSLCDDRGARGLFGDFKDMVLTCVSSDIDCDWWQGVMVGCRTSLEGDNCDEALSTVGVEDILPTYEKSLIIKLLLASSDYDVFISMMRELQLESGCAEVSVFGSSISNESQQAMIKMMDTNQTGIFGDSEADK